MIVIKNLPELVSLLERLQGGEDIPLSSIDMSTFHKVKIKIKGDNNTYNGTLNYNLCQGLLDFQTEIWQAYAKIKYGSAKVNRLSQEEKKALTVNFSINDGCTELLSDFNNLLSFLVKFTDGMDGTEKIIVLAILVGGILIHRYQNFKHDEQMRLIETTREYKMFGKLDELVSAFNALNKNMKIIKKGMEKAYTSLIRGVKDADEVSITSSGIEVDLDKSDIKILTGKVSEPKNREYETRKAFVSKLFTSGDNNMMVSFRDEETGVNFSTTIPKDEFSDDLSGDIVRSMISSTPIFVTGLFHYSNNEIRSVDLEKVSKDNK